MMASRQARLCVWLLKVNVMVLELPTTIENTNPPSTPPYPLFGTLRFNFFPVRIAAQYFG
jgi:hypothetical protein